MKQLYANPEQKMLKPQDKTQRSFQIPSKNINTQPMHSGESGGEIARRDKESSEDEMGR